VLHEVGSPDNNGLDVKVIVELPVISAYQKTLTDMDVPETVPVRPRFRTARLPVQVPPSSSAPMVVVPEP
jgi:hypothetical protein